ncbi:MAG: (2Fe-2S)-binding protein [Pseudomonadota bacterium]
MTVMKISVNGRAIETDVAPTTLLIDLLRGDLALTGTHMGCDTAQCGACTVLIDGAAVKSCSILALQAQDKAVTTVEGLANQQGADALHPLQEAFIACHGLQCGFCTPGMMMAAAGLLATNPAPSEDEIVRALDGNICRCTGYTNIVAAVKQAAGAMTGAKA